MGFDEKDLCRNDLDLTDLRLLKSFISVKKATMTASLVMWNYIRFIQLQNKYLLKYNYTDFLSAHGQDLQPALIYSVQVDHNHHNSRLAIIEIVIGIIKVFCCLDTDNEIFLNGSKCSY